MIEISRSPKESIKIWSRNFCILCLQTYKDHSTTSNILKLDIEQYIPAMRPGSLYCALRKSEPYADFMIEVSCSRRNPHRVRTFVYNETAFTWRHTRCWKTLTKMGSSVFHHQAARQEHDIKICKEKYHLFSSFNSIMDLDIFRIHHHHIFLSIDKVEWVFLRRGSSDA